MLRQRLLCVVILFTATGLRVEAQPAAPAPPKEYQVQIRYRIQAARNERVRQYAMMMGYFEALGLQREPGDDNEAEDNSHVRITGRISSANARKLLDDSHVKSILLLPVDYKLPGLDDLDKPVKVQLELVGGLPLAQQRLLAIQVGEQLKELGFREAISYDHRGFTRMVGLVRGGEVETLLKDLRGEPSGWLVPKVALADLPMPLRALSPIRVTEVIPEPDGVAPIKEPVAPLAGLENQLKISQELRELLANADAAAKPARLEIILVATPSDSSTSWKDDLYAAVPQLIVEGRYGPIVTGLMPPDKAQALADLSIVSAVRLPRFGASLPPPPVAVKDRNREALTASGLVRLHNLGQRGKGVRVAVIGADFRGWDTAVKNKHLPATTRLLDLTRQRSTEIEPEPYPDDKQPQGHGTDCARALAVAAPLADLLLIRIDPTMPFQLLSIARNINGEAPQSDMMDQRREDLDAAYDDVQQRWKVLLQERKDLLDDFAADEEAIKKREDHFAKAKALKDEEASYQNRLERFLQHQRDLRNLQRLQVVVNTLSWPEGHLIDGSGPLTQYLNNRPFRSTIWFQPAGDTRAQTWTGLFRDGEGNGIMDFAPPGTPLPRGRWTPALNFLAWQPWEAKQAAELPEKARVRLTMQWREAHEPKFLERGEDLYREPLAALRMLLLRQRDPSATKLPADDMELTAYSSGMPLRIDNAPSWATYQQTLDVTLDGAGVYALRVDGRAPTSIRPPSAPSPGAQKQFDLRVRIFVEVIDPMSSGAGRPVFLDYATTEGAIGMPGDSQSVATIGAIGRGSLVQASSASGPPMSLELLAKPNFLSFDGLEVGAGEVKGASGTAVAASFAAGLTATALGANVPPGAFLMPPPARSVPLLRIPDNWPIQRPPAR